MCARERKKRKKKKRKKKEKKEKKERTIFHTRSNSTSNTNTEGQDDSKMKLFFVRITILEFNYTVSLTKHFQVVGSRFKVRSVVAATRP